MCVTRWTSWNHQIIRHWGKRLGSILPTMMSLRSRLILMWVCQSCGKQARQTKVLGLHSSSLMPGSTRTSENRESPRNKHRLSRADHTRLNTEAQHRIRTMAQKELRWKTMRIPEAQTCRNTIFPSTSRQEPISSSEGMAPTRAKHQAEERELQRFRYLEGLRGLEEEHSCSHPGN